MTSEQPPDTSSDLREEITPLGDAALGEAAPGEATQSPYTPEYYAAQRDDSQRSADATVPFIMELVSPRSVVDVGCGVGTWLAAFSAAGVEHILGMDGDYVAREMLQIPPSTFMPVDLTQPVTLNRVFDLAVCLEVGEHIQAEHADTLIGTLTTLASVVLFSAAIPHQGGEDHVNEQWQAYWAEKFRQRGYVPVDAVRKRIWEQAQIVPIYRQNMLLYCAPRVLEANERLAAEARLTNERMLSIVHPDLYLSIHPKGQEYVELGAWTRHQQEVIDTQQAHVAQLEHDLAEMHTWAEQQDTIIKAQQAHEAQLEHDLAEMHTWAEQQDTIIKELRSKQRG